MKKSIFIFLLAGVLAGGIAIGYAAGITREKGALATMLEIIHPIRENDPAYKFINPLLAYIIPSANEQGEFKILKDNLSSFINAQKQAGRLTSASVFFSSLDEGRWVGVGEDQKYTPASMLKVVIMVAYFKEKETAADILEKQLVYTDELDRLLRNDMFNAQSGLSIGKSYTVDALIRSMIIDSDNGAELLLLANINDGYLNAIYGALGIENPEQVAHFTISPRNYSLFFRILYSATYLSKSSSEKVLEILSKTTFNDGIVAGLPRGTVVSHKFGEHVEVAGNSIASIELHDCGIVYHASDPYLLCIMTKGGNLDTLKDAIKNISSLVHESLIR